MLVSQRVGVVQWALPTLIVLFVILYQTWFVDWMHEHIGQNAHYIMELFLYGAVGPLVTFFVLAWIRRWLVEKERVEAKMREQERRLVLVRVQEGKRVAQHLHREVLPNLAYVANKIDHTRTKHLPEASKHANDALRTASETLRETIGELREKINLLRKGAPLNGFEQGTELAGALRQRAEEFAALFQVRIEVKLLGKLHELAYDLAASVWRIIGEALNNTALHAQANTVVIRVDSDQANRLTLEVNDDGVGFDPGAKPSGGLGLTHMAEEVHRWGGTLAIDAKPGSGTRIRVEIPLGQEGDVA